MPDFLRFFFGDPSGPPDGQPWRQPSSSRSQRQSGVDFARMRRDAQRAAQKTARKEAQRAARNAARAADSWSAELLGLNRDLHKGLFDGWDWFGKPVANHMTSRRDGDRSLEDRISDELRDFFSGGGWKW